MARNVARAWEARERFSFVWGTHGVLFPTSDGARYRFADARTGRVTDAFETRDVLEARKGPLELLTLQGDDAWGLVGDEFLAIDTGNGETRPLDPGEMTPVHLEPLRTEKRSRRRGTKETNIVFVNATDAPMQLVWHDFDGGRKTYATVEPGGRHRQHTFSGHVWTAKTEDGETLASYVGDEAIRIAYVDGRKPAHAGRPEATARRYDLAIRDNQLVLVDRRAGRESPLGEPNTADDRYVLRRAQWSPNNRYVMALREAPAQERHVTIVDTAPKDRVQPRTDRYAYLKPGDRIARPRPHIFDVRKKKRIELPEDRFQNPWAINHFSWSADGKRFRFLYNQRGHQVMRLLEIDAAKKKVRAIIEEKCETFFDYSQKTYLKELRERKAWIWMSERSGWNHLYLVDDKTGEAKPITKGDWVVRAVERVDEEAGQIWFRALGVYEDQDPYHVHFGRVDLDGSNLTWLTEGDGTHEISFSPDGSLYVDTYSHAERAPVRELRRAKDGSLVAKLHEIDVAALRRALGRLPERFVAKGRDGKTDIWGLIYTPSNLDPKTSYPVIESIYAGPHGHFVPKRFRHWSMQRRLAELGFVVVQIDGMGTNWRSKAFHDLCWKNLGDSGFPDRIAWMRAAAQERPYMDLSRVGIFGGSAGGQSALRALLAHGDFYKVAVADCGCHDNRMDKIWWNEAWMGWPVGDHYAEQSNVTQAHKLEGKLLLTVGEVDRNVDPASTMQVVDALIQADKDFDLIVFPGHGHGAGESPYGRRRRIDFFIRHLLGVEPRWE